MGDEVKSYICQECHTKISPPDLYHPYLFCVLHMAGYSRKRIIVDIKTAAAKLGKDSNMSLDTRPKKS